MIRVHASGGCLLVQSLLHGGAYLTAYETDLPFKVGRTYLLSEEQIGQMAALAERRGL